MSIVKVTDRPDLVKDMNSGAVLTVDRRKADEYLVKKNQINKMREVEEEMKDIKSKLAEIDALKENLCEIKNLLKEIVNK